MKSSGVEAKAGQAKAKEMAAAAKARENLFIKTSKGDVLWYLKKNRFSSFMEKLVTSSKLI